MLYYSLFCLEGAHFHENTLARYIPIYFNNWKLLHMTNRTLRNGELYVLIRLEKDPAWAVVCNS